MNKNLKYNLIAIGLVTGLSIISIQNTLSRPMFGMQPGQVNASKILTRMDYNNDGIISEEDLLNRMLEKAERRFNRQDTNADGMLSLDEFSIKPGRFEAIDHDAVRTCVVEALAENPIEGIDTSFPIRPSPEEAFSLADSNADDSIDGDEYTLFITNRAAERFSYMDADSNTVLSEEEMTTALEIRSVLRQIRHDCISEQDLLEE